MMNWKDVECKWSKAAIRYYPRVIPAWNETNHENPWYKHSHSLNQHSNVPNTKATGYRLVTLPNSHLSGSGISRYKK